MKASDKYAMRKMKNFLNGEDVEKKKEIEKDDPSNNKERKRKTENKDEILEILSKTLKKAVNKS